MCKNCGANYDADDNYCQKCGSKVEAIPTLEPVKQSEKPTFQEKMVYKSSTPAYQGYQTADPNLKSYVSIIGTLEIIFGIFALIGSIFLGLLTAVSILLTISLIARGEISPNSAILSGFAPIQASHA